MTVTAQRHQALAGPVLAQIRDFVEEAPEAAAVNPLAVVLRTVRGQELRMLGLGAVVGLLFLVLAVLLIQPAFQSSGLVRILAREAKILYADADDSRLRLYDAVVTAEMNILRSRPILEEALLRLRSEEDAPYTPPENVGQLAELFEYKNNKGLVSVAARSGDPDLSMAALNALLEAYDGANRERHRRQFAVREAELADRERDLEARLATLDARYLEIGGEHDLGTLSKAHVARTAQLQVMDERLDEIDNTINQVQATGASGADVGDIEIQRATLLDNALANMTFERAQRLADMQTLRSRYQPGHPKVRDAEAELAAIEGAISERLDQIATLGKAGALTGGGSEQSIEDLERVRARLLQRRAAVRAEAEELNTRLVRIRSVHEERARVHELLVETKRALDEVVVESSNDLSGTIEVVAWGARPDGPIEDKRKPLGLGAGIFGGLASFAAVVLLTLLAGRLRWSDDLDGRLENGRLVQVVPEGADAARLDRAGVAIRDALDLKGLGSGALIALAGTDPDVGAARSARALAGALAGAEVEAGRRVLRLEGGALAAAIAAGARLDDVLVRDAAGVRLLASDCERLERAPVTLDGLRAVLGAAQGRFDRVILDLGPLSAGSFTHLALSLADAALVITGRGARASALTETLERVQRHCGDAWVAVFGRAAPRDPGLDPA
ncbi:MAG: hypothetical protein V2J24_02705 [Pseudomonadales bacterium]|jgi:uncharacterized protein involved in exopolysaccharide biosynthesis|nr:hypothetical protein [Pseudomonadales bacterium]